MNFKIISSQHGALPRNHPVIRPAGMIEMPAGSGMGGLKSLQIFDKTPWELTVWACRFGTGSVIFEFPTDHPGNAVFKEMSPVAHDVHFSRRMGSGEWIAFDHNSYGGPQAVRRFELDPSSPTGFRYQDHDGGPALSHPFVYCRTQVAHWLILKHANGRGMDLATFSCSRYRQWSEILSLGVPEDQLEYGDTQRCPIIAKALWADAGKIHGLVLNWEDRDQWRIAEFTESHGVLAGQLSDITIPREAHIAYWHPVPGTSTILAILKGEESQAVIYDSTSWEITFRFSFAQSPVGTLAIYTMAQGIQIIPGYFILTCRNGILILDDRLNYVTHHPFQFYGCGSDNRFLSSGHLHLHKTGGRVLAMAGEASWSPTRAGIPRTPPPLELFWIDEIPEQALVQRPQRSPRR